MSDLQPRCHRFNSTTLLSYNLGQVDQTHMRSSSGDATV